MQSSTQAAMDMDQRRATETCSARNAVTGPWTAEYGPFGAAKRKMLRVQSIATRERARLGWPDVNIGENHYTSLYDINERFLTNLFCRLVSVKSASSSSCSAGLVYPSMLFNHAGRREVALPRLTAAPPGLLCAASSPTSMEQAPEATHSSPHNVSHQ